MSGITTKAGNALRWFVFGKTRPGWKKLTMGLFWGLGALFLGQWTVQHLVINSGVSLPQTFFWKTGGVVEQGDYVTFWMDHKLMPRPATVVKRVVCTEGHVLEEKTGWVYCDGEFLGISKPETKDGRPMEPFVWNGPVPKGKVFVMGTHRDSFDSRYVGFIDAQVVSRVVPLL